MKTVQAVRDRAAIEEIAVSLATRGGLLISGLAIQSLLAYTLLPTGRGAFAVCILFAALLGVLLTPGVDAGSQYYVMAGKMTLSQGVAVSLTICLFGGALAVLVAIPLIRSQIPFFQKANETSFYLTTILVPLSTFAVAIQQLLAGLRRFVQIAWISLVQTAANGAVLVVLLVGLRLGVDGALIAACTGNFAMIVMGLRYLRRNCGFGWERPSSRSVMFVLRYGLKHYLARIGWGVDLRVGVLLLGVIATGAEVGFFAVASGLMMRFFLIPNSVFGPLLARIVKEGGRPELVSFCARISTWLTGAALLVFLAVAVPVVRVILSPEFLPIVPLARTIAPGILVYSGAIILNAYFRATNRPHIPSLATGVGLGCTLLLVPVLYPLLGVHAAAWGMTVGFFARSAILSVLYYRVTRSAPAIFVIFRQGDLRRIQTVRTSALWRSFSRSSNGSDA